MNGLDSFTSASSLGLGMSLWDTPAPSASAEFFASTPTSTSSATTRTLSSLLEIDGGPLSADPIGAQSSGRQSGTISLADHNRIMENVKAQYMRRLSDMRADCLARVARAEAAADTATTTAKAWRDEVLAAIQEHSAPPAPTTFMWNGIPIPMEEIPERAHDPVAHAKITFWAEEPWGPYKGKKRLAHQSREQDTGVPNFLQNLEGEVMSKARWADLKAETRLTLNTLCAHGMPATTWKGIDQFSRRHLQTSIYPKFPELTYCDRHWKLHQFMTREFSDWNPRAEAVAASAQFRPIGDVPVIPVKKRGRSESCVPPPSAKRSRTQGPAAPTAGETSSSSLAQDDDSLGQDDDSLGPDDDSDNSFAQDNTTLQPLASSSSRTQRVNFALLGDASSSETSPLSPRLDEHTEGSSDDPSSSLAQPGPPPRAVSPVNGERQEEGPTSPPNQAAAATDPLADFFSAAPPPVANPHKDTTRPRARPTGDSSNGKMRLAKTTTARNLYAIAYAKENPHATGLEFTAAWDLLTASNNNTFKDYHAMDHFALANTTLAANEVEANFHAIPEAERQVFYAKGVSVRKGKKKAT